MPLKVRIKPEHKLFVGDAVIKNVGSRPCDLLILTDHKVLREKSDVAPRKKDTWTPKAETAA